MDRPVRVQLRRSKGWQMPENTVVVSRPGPLGNPFVVGKHGTRAECVKSFRILMSGFVCLSIDREMSDEQVAYLKRLAGLLPGLRGKNLACWCPLPKPGEPDCCHAACLLEIANAPEKADADPA